MMRLIYLLLFFLISCNQESSQKLPETIPFSNDINVDDDFYFEKGVYTARGKENKDSR